MVSVAADQLRDVLVKSQALPVLFAGSGLSRRFLGTPDWDGLLEHFSELTARPISYYRGRAKNDRPKIAQYIAEELYEKWFYDDEYEDSRVAFEAEISLNSDPLKYEISQYIAQHQPLDDAGIAAELEALSKVRLHAVITTNWDTVLEEHLKDLEVFVGQQDILFSTTQAVGEIYKIHGSITEPKSLIVTSDDYSAYWDRNPYLIAKLLTMLVEHPVLFVGYGLGDSHINRMLENLVACLTSEQIEVLNDRLVFIRRAKHNEESTLQRGSITVGAHTLSIREYICADFLELFEMLGSLPERFPARLLRRLQQSVYELTFSTEPSGRVHVLPMDAEKIDEAEIVVGVGMMERLGEKGYKAIGRAELCHDMLNYETDHNTERLTNDLLSNLLRGAKYVPVYYPWYLDGRLNENGELEDTSGIPANAKALVSGSTKLNPYLVRETALRKKQTFRDLLQETDENIALEYGLICVYELEDVVALKSFLLEKTPKSGTVTTQLAKLCCKYDHLVYGPHFEGDRKELHNALGISPKTKRKSDL